MVSYKQKFKVWNIKEKKWEENIFLDQSGNFYNSFKNILYPTSDRNVCINMNLTSSSIHVILFSTLLNDKNNNEIFQSDILRHYSAGNINDDDYIISRLENRFIMLSMHKPKILELTNDILNQYEKIGNVYSNPELLISNHL